MKPKKFVRLCAGLGIILVILFGAYLLVVRPWHARWGATRAEQAQALPGDEGLPQPANLWTRAVTIHATPAEIYPWLLQIGQGRGGFYSYDWLENLLGFNIHSATKILPEFQNPPVGANIPLFPGGDFVRVRSLEPNRSLVLNALGPDGKTVFWIWSLNLLPGSENQTRLVIRNRMGDATLPIQPAEQVMFAVLEPLDVLMELKMLHGIQQRAEGRLESPLVMAIEISVWLGALLIGLVAGVRVLVQPDWRGPLAVGIAAVLLLLYFTFLYPPLWLRVGLDLALLAGLIWSWQKKGEPQVQVTQAAGQV